MSRLWMFAGAVATLGGYTVALMHEPAGVTVMCLGLVAAALGFGSYCAEAEHRARQEPPPPPRDQQQGPPPPEPPPWRNTLTTSQRWRMQ